MQIVAELLTKPGPKTLFLAEFRVEREANVTPVWWGLWLSWWLYRPKFWRSMLWGWERTDTEGWSTWQVRLLGFEINWQRRKPVE